MTATVHAAPVVLTMTSPPLRDGAILIEHDRVVQVGPRSQMPTSARIREWRGVLTPGLVNAHAHLQYGAPFAHLATAGLPFAEWLLQLGEISAGLTETDWQVSARGSAHQLLKSGTTAVADLVSRPEPIAVVTSLGLQGISYAELAPVDSARWPSMLGSLVYRDTSQLARGAEDRARLREHRTVVALRTRSNKVLGAEEAPVADYLREGGLVAIGTDSLASSPDLDLLAEARATRDLAVRQGLAKPEKHLVRALTLGGAQALGLEIGTLVPGGRADLAVFDVDVEDPYRALIDEGAGRCVATVLGGRLVHRR